MTDDEKRRAIHEAGHAILAHLEGCVILEVSILPTAEDGGGLMVDHYPDVTAKTKTLLAGMIAERIMYRDSKYHEADEKFYLHQEGVDILYAEVEEELRARWDAVVRVAEALLSNTVLTAHALNALLLSAPHKQRNS